jgi:hypothetical protein
MNSNQQQSASSEAQDSTQRKQHIDFLKQPIEALNIDTFVTEPATASVNPINVATSSTANTENPISRSTQSRVLFQTKVDIDDLGDSLSDLNSQSAFNQEDRHNLNALDPNHVFIF